MIEVFCRRCGEKLSIEKVWLAGDFDVCVIVKGHLCLKKEPVRREKKERVTKK